MMRTFLTALTVVGLLACGNKRPEPGARHTAARSAPTARAKSSSSRTTSKTRSRADTTTSKNPLTNR